MNNIPTIEELFESKNPQDGKLPQWAKKLAIEFTKLHVKAALETAAENVSRSNGGDYFEESILKAYPESNIK